MRRLLAFGIAFAAIPTVLPTEKTVSPPAPSAIIKIYCVSCHSGARHFRRTQ